MPKGCTPTATIATNKPTKREIMKPLNELIDVAIGFLNAAINVPISWLILPKKLRKIFICNINKVFVRPSFGVFG
ncbi:hypothetical protein GCM10011514_44870 [Emticicia aquatilis]|uniref:Uncharacterized protein n=1 Tax=Emticicia aquatilis TaxID=1537369 RepID=A0A916Z4K9_9BACT|nr:hypothetical protein GCM10011514_44870 [Emticicia aquatilis]